MSWESLGTDSSLKGGLWGIQQKKDLKKVVLSKNYTYIRNYPENFNFIVCGVRTQNYFNVQVHAHSCGTISRYFYKNNIVHIKILTIECWAYWQFLLCWISLFYNKEVIFIIRIIIILSPYFGGKNAFPSLYFRLPNSVAMLTLKPIMLKYLFTL